MNSVLPPFFFFFQMPISDHRRNLVEKTYKCWEYYPSMMRLREPWLSLSHSTTIYCRPTVCRPLRIQRGDTFHFMGFCPVWICVTGMCNFCNQNHNQELLLLPKKKIPLSNSPSQHHPSLPSRGPPSAPLLTHPSHEPAQPFTLQPLVSLKREWQT